VDQDGKALITCCSSDITTDADGRVGFTLPAGRYTVKAQRGATGETVSTIIAGQRTTATLKLELAR
jgi:hypothetical protein